MAPARLPGMSKVRPSIKASSITERWVSASVWIAENGQSATQVRHPEHSSAVM